MTTPYPLPREFRVTDVLHGDGRPTYGPFSFMIWDVADIVASVSRANAAFADETIVVAKVTSDAFAYFTVTFSPALQAGDRAIVRSQRLHERSASVTRGGSISTVGLEAELSKQATVLQELRRDIGATDEALSDSVDDLQAQIDADAPLRAQAIQAAQEQADRALDERVKAEAAAASAAGSSGDASTALGETEAVRDGASTLVGEAQAILIAAQAGFTGYPEGTLLDEGYEGPYDGPTYFDIDEGYES